MFQDRRAAGHLLAQRILPWQGDTPVVLALPRGGVPVAAELASALGAPLGLLHVRKIGAPMHSELAVAAVADGPRPYLAVNRDIAAELGVTEAYLRDSEARELREIARRRQLYEGDMPPPAIKGKTVILVDDGIATGATARAAVLALRDGNAASVILAVPVASPSALAQLAPLVDQIVCLEAPAHFSAVGEFYADFHQVPDGEVQALMWQARARTDKKPA